MKKTPNLLMLFLIGGSLLAQNANDRPEAQITFRVQTDENRPVSGAQVGIGTFDHRVPGELFGTDVSANRYGITDSNGMITLSMPSLTGNFGYWATKMAYYRTGGDYYIFKASKDHKWQPWNPTIDLVLKPIINPIPMYARKMGLMEPLTIPAANQPIGFDLEAGDWVAPYGKGSISDFIFTFTETMPFVRATKPFDATLSVSFSNKGDGVQPIIVPINKGSELRLPRYAPENGFEPTLVKHIGRPAEGQPLNTDVKEDENYFFRVRTVMDGNDKIKSALYGKIDGDIQFWGNRGLRFTYYLNPTPNDRNMEFDPKNNSFGRLPPLVQVRTP